MTTPEPEASDLAAPPRRIDRSRPLLWQSAKGQGSRVEQQARRQERLRANGAADTFTRLEIFERDRWTCHICGEPVDRTLNWPDCECAVVDHIVAIWEGGTHTLDNVACAHNHCNGDKTNTRNPETLRKMRDQRKARLLICEAEGLPRRASRSDRALAEARAASGRSEP